MADLPSNVYRVRQRDFDAIPGSPWVYWIPDGLRELFETLPRLGDMAPSIHGSATYDNFRFLRFWWEAGLMNIGRHNRSWDEFETCQRSYVPYMKGGSFKRWYGNQEVILQLTSRGRVLIEFLNSKRDSIRGGERIFQEGITYSFLTSSRFSARISPGGFIFDVAGSSLFPKNLLLILGTMNSSFASYALKLINPTVNFQVGDLARLPVLTTPSVKIETLTRQAIAQAKLDSTQDETTYDFVAPPRWDTGLTDLSVAEARLAALEAKIDDEVYHLYGISDEDRAAIEAELASQALAVAEDDGGTVVEGVADEESAEAETSMTPAELAVRWISYAVGILLGRFSPGVSGTLGCAVYRREGFAVGSLPAPDVAEFDALVGLPERFAYVDETGGRHLFPAEVEAALRALALPDGIAVLDAGHPRDLPTLVERALTLMLDTPIDGLRLTIDEETSGNRQSKIVNRQSAAVIQAGANGDLRAFLSKDFFTQWHFKWYRKRPVYWSLQSAKRNYGFVLVHERVGQYTLYTLMRDYLDYKRNGVKLALGDLTAQRETQSGAARKRTERQIAELNALQEELAEFAKTLDRLARSGYEPASNWIDDGVLLRLAPLWELIPLWKSEPRKAWQALEAGKYDWSHIALRYWPERVKAACKANKSYAIAHGHEEWYEGK
jgi:hypothetical protein